jgi:hypothetical protein
MWKQLLYKWFGLSDAPCLTCDVLRVQLDKSEAERRELLTRLLAKDTPEPLSTEKEEYAPIQPQHIPWRVRQQMLEAEDRKKAQLMKSKTDEIEQLEKELGIGGTSASQVS